MIAVHVHLLGNPRVLLDGREVLRPRGHKVWALMAYLLGPQAPVRRPQLASLLFGDADDALGALRWNLCQMRRLLPGVEVGGGALRLEPPPHFWVDVLAACRQQDVDPADALLALERDLLEGIAFPSAPAFDRWLEAERERVRSAARAVVHGVTLARLYAGDVDSAAALSARLVADSPLEESFQALRVRCLVAAGQASAAAREAEAFRERFRIELGREPTALLDQALIPSKPDPSVR